MTEATNKTPHRAITTKCKYGEKYPNTAVIITIQLISSFNSAIVMFRSAILAGLESVKGANFTSCDELLSCCCCNEKLYKRL